MKRARRIQTVVFFACPVLRRASGGIFKGLGDEPFGTNSSIAHVGTRTHRPMRSEEIFRRATYNLKRLGYNRAVMRGSA